MNVNMEPPWFPELTSMAKQPTLARHFSSSPDQTSELLRDFKDRALTIQERINSNMKTLTESDMESLQSALLELIFQFETVCRKGFDTGSPDPDYLQFVRRELLPYMLLSDNARRWYEKPMGYAGDFMTMKRLYHRETEGTGILGQVIDATLLDLPPVEAVRHRRQFLRDELLDLIESNPESSLSITSLACGSAEEVFDLLGTIPEASSVKFNLIDVDPKAITYLNKKAESADAADKLEIYRRNVIYLINKREHLDLEPQDLIYSAGLIDYFDDELVREILDWSYELLAPGGRVILGNFHPRNPNRALMDNVFDWQLVHRDGEDLRKLVEASPFNESSPVLKQESHKINIFIECEKS